jgi:drug/metabolite transporter (DMT)-like permease
MRAFGGSVLVVVGVVLVAVAWIGSSLSEGCDGDCPTIVDGMVPVLLLGVGCLIGGAVAVARAWRDMGDD